MMNTEEMFSSLKQVFTERLTSPFWGSFIMSWVIINYEFIMIIFSDNSVSTTIQLIQTYSFTDALDLFLKGVLAPLIASLIYIYLYPIPALKFYEYTLNEQIKLNNLKIEKSKIELVEASEVAKIRTKFSLERKHLQEQISEAQSERDALADKLSGLTARLNELRIANPQTSDKYEDFDGFSPEQTLENDFSKITPSEQLVLKTICDLRGSAYRDELWELVPDLVSVEIDSVLDDLTKQNIIDANLTASKGGRFSLTPKGRKISVRLLKQPNL